MNRRTRVLLVAMIAGVIGSTGSAWLPDNATTAAPVAHATRTANAAPSAVASEDSGQRARKIEDAANAGTLLRAADQAHATDHPDLRVPIRRLGQPRESATPEAPVSSPARVAAPSAQPEPASFGGDDLRTTPAFNRPRNLPAGVIVPDRFPNGVG